MLPLYELNEMAGKLVALLNTERTQENQKAIQAQQSYLIEKMNAPEYQSLMKNRHAQVSFEHMKKALEKESVTGLEKARMHAQKMLKQVRPVSNDNPLKAGDKVCVIRHEHGWLDGSYEGKIYSAFMSNGIWGYNVQVTNVEGKDVDPFHIEVNHTRDLHKLF